MSSCLIINIYIVMDDALLLFNKKKKDNFKSVVSAHTILIRFVRINITKYKMVNDIFCITIIITNKKLYEICLLH